MKSWINYIIIAVLVAAISVFLYTSPKQALADWYATGGTWTYRKAITIDPAQVSGTADHTNFPVLVDLTDAGLQANAQADGDDILFTSSDGSTKLDHEIELYTTATGRLTAWVEIPTLDYDNDTVIYMYYGNSGATNQQNVTGVWDSNYMGVWHIPDGTTITTLDSTSNDRDGTNTGVAAVAGKIDGGGRWDGSTSTDNIGTVAFTPPATKTISMWFNLDAIDATARRYWTHKTYSSQMFSDTAGNNTMFQQNFDGAADGAWYIANPSTGAWHYLTVTYDDSSTTNDPIIYLDGVSQSITKVVTPVGAALNGSGGVAIGNRETNDRSFDGNLDEFRYSNIIRSADWISTEYNNQSATSTFYTIGSEETDSVGGGSGETPTVKVKGGLKVKGGVEFK